MPYGELLASEGRADEAAAFLDAWQPICRHLNSDTFTLVDVLVLSAMTKTGSVSADVYETLGDDAEADHTRGLSPAFNAPIANWQTLRKQREASPEYAKSWTVVEESGSILHRLMLPALGEAPTYEDMASGRALEYVLLERLIFSLISWLMLGIMFGCLVLPFRWRRASGGHRAMLLSPRKGQFLEVFGWGVLAPLLGYLLLIHVTPLGDRGFSVMVAGSKTLLAGAVLALSVVGLTAGTAIRRIRERCELLGLDLPMPGKRVTVLNTICMAIVVVAAMLILIPVKWLDVVIGHLSINVTLYAALSMLTAGLLAIGLCASLLVALARGVFANENLGLYYGTAARSLIPFLALAVVFISLSSHHVLRDRESWHARHDAIFAANPETPGFSAIEAGIVTRLQEELTTALKE